MSSYTNAKKLIDGLADLGDLTPGERIAYAQAVATMAQTDAVHAVFAALQRIAATLEPSSVQVLRGGTADLPGPTLPRPFKESDPLLRDDAV